jgi:hypothetical protein
MSPWLLAVTVASASGQPVQIPGAPPLPPHMHYEIRIDNVSVKHPEHLTDAQRLQRICEFASGISARLNASEKADLILMLDLAEVKSAACGNPKSK